jgi:BASS family bile acid:Na+ symporter
MSNHDIFAEIVLPCVLGFINIGIGLSLTLQDFRNLFVYPKAIVVGLLTSNVLLPCVAFGLVSLTDFPPAVKVGVILIAASPGGSAANLITHMLKANVALSISMTSITGLVSLFSIPVTVSLALSLFYDGVEAGAIQVPVEKIFVKVALVTVLPVSIGMYIRHARTSVAHALERPLAFVMPVLLGLSFLGVMLFPDTTQPATKPPNYVAIAGFELGLNLLGMTFGYLIAKALRLDKPSSTTIGIEVGLHNSALAIYIAKNVLRHIPANGDMAMVAVIYGSFTFFSAVAFGLVVNWKEIFGKPPSSTAP